MAMKYPIKKIKTNCNNLNFKSEIQPVNDSMLRRVENPLFAGRANSI